MYVRIKKLYKYRTMVSSLVKRDLKSRYSGSILGVLWNFMNPLLQLLVYTMAFSQIVRMGINDYYMFLFVALIPWIFFSTCVSAGTSCILIQGDMIKKIFFPREVIPISFVVAQFVNMLLCFVVVFAVMILGGYPFNILAIICMPIVMLVELVLAMGCTMLLSSLNVYFRDLQHIMGIVAMAWQFLTPVMYPIEAVPNNFMWIFNLNPMTSIIICYRDILYYGKVPQINTMLTATVWGVVLFCISWGLFDRLQRRFAEVL